jgi:SAM-dependent methyltransferase
MDPSEYKTMFAVEDRHWWYDGMRQITTALVGRLYPGRADLAILDAGCGTGAAMTYLAPFGRVTGCDFSALALGFCRQRGLDRLGQASVVHLPFATGAFDLVTSFDVLCHRAVGDYRLALAEFWRVLRPGGRLLLRLPAYDWLHAHHDQVVHTIHRFTAAELRQALPDSHFAVEKVSYANTLLFPLALAKRAAERLGGGGNGGESDIHPNPEWQDRLLSRFLYAEAAWLARGSLPFGLTVLAVGRKVGPAPAGQSESS